MATAVSGKPTIRPLSQIREFMSYDPETGTFTCIKSRPYAQIKPGHQVAAYAKASRDYARINFGGKMYYGHRLAWWFVYGRFPEGALDHINGDPSDNRISNLRIATRAQNGQNKAPKNNRSSRYKGLKKSRGGKWVAKITVNKKEVYLGKFQTEIEAAQAYDRAARHYFGEFARPNFPKEQTA